MSEDRICIKISVRNLVEFILREGDIDNRVSRLLPDAMQEGSRIHRKIQKSMPAAYQAEVPLNITIQTDDYDIVVEGRADGILTEDTVTIDEIKGIYMDLFYLKEPFVVHLAQAKCYGYMYALKNNLSQISVRMTYCSLLDEDIKRFQYQFSFEELSDWFAEIIERYKKWSDFSYLWKIKKTASIKQLEFPFSYREGQKDLAAGVYRTVYHGKKLFIQAGTGVGKTISTIFPAVKAVGEGIGEKIFYLTAKTVTANVALDTYDLLRDKGLKWKTIHITAKEKVCLCDKTECNPVACPYAKGHYDRVNDAVYALITENDSLSRDCMITYAEKYKVCPFEMCLDASLWVDSIIADYNYVFDPNVQLKRFFGDNVKGDYLFLIDEAHNLVDRAREMYSAELIKEDFLKLKNDMKDRNRKITKHLDKCNKSLLELKKTCTTYVIEKQTDSFALRLMGLYAEMEKYLNEEDVDADSKNEILEFYFTIRHFLAMYESMDNHSLIYSELLENGNFKLKLFCVNPSRKIEECLKKGRSTIFFSATLLPINYYYKLLGGKEEDYSFYAKTPFDTRKRCLLIADDVSSKYSRRNDAEYRKVAAYISSVVKCKTGNYMAFFPSYKYMNEVYQIFERDYKEEEDICIIQESSMSEKQREEFLDYFLQNSEKEEMKNLIGFCVMGGIFSEGIDLKEKQLIGTIIVGTGLPQISNERKILSEYFKEEGVNGFDYAYRFPGMNKILQSAGRVIRTVNDEGIILLLDERFLENVNMRLFPMEWSSFTICNQDTVMQQLNNFWKNRN